MVADMDDEPVNILSRTCKHFYSDASFAHDGIRPQRARDGSRRGSLGCRRMMGTARAGGRVQVLTDWVFLKPSLGEPKTGHIRSKPRKRRRASCWCERGDSNPHGFTRQILSYERQENRDRNSYHFIGIAARHRIGHSRIRFSFANVTWFLSAVGGLPLSCQIVRVQASRCWPTWPQQLS